MPATTIRAAVPDDAALLTGMALRAKAHWGYAREQIDLWRGDLAISADSIRSLPTYVAVRDGVAAGFCQLLIAADPPHLEHLFVEPDFIGQGVGTELLRHALAYLASQGFAVVAIDVEPHAERFYASRGAWRVGAIAAPIAGDPARERPQMRLRTDLGHPDAAAH